MSCPWERQLTEQKKFSKKKVVTIARQRDQDMLHLFSYIVAFSLPSVKTTSLDRWTLFSHLVLLVTKWTSAFQVKGACKFLVISWPWEVYTLGFLILKVLTHLKIYSENFEKKKQWTKNKINKNECSDWNDWWDKYQKTE